MSGIKQANLHVVPLGNNSGKILTRVLQQLGKTASEKCWQHKNPSRAVVNKAKGLSVAAKSSSEV